MHRLSTINIKGKLLLIALLTSGIAILSASGIFITAEVMFTRRALVQELSTTAEIIGANSTAAIVFDDDAAAEEILSALKTKDNIFAATIVTADGEVFAEYVGRGGAEPPIGRRDAQSAAPATAPDFETGGVRFFDSHAEFTRRIVLDGQTIGWLGLKSDLGYVQERKRVLLGTATLAISLSFLIAIVLSSRLQRVISAPVLHLAGVMKAVSAQRDYSIRAQKHGQDELGSLIDGFNAMLGQIQEHEGSLSAARRQAEAANRAKTDFLATMSHELRTPLNAVIGFSDIIAQEILGPLGDGQYRDYAREINDSGRQLLQMIDEILDISKVETGRMTLNEAPMAIADVVERCLELVRQRIEAAGLGLTVDIDPGLPPFHGDERLIKQSLLHLLFNAVKFTASGGQLAIRVLRDEDGGLAISVTDTGIGIAAKDVPRALAPFSQVDGSLAREYGGAGLGLTLVQCFVELHGGRLEIDSEPGIGTTVSMRFPAERSRSDSKPAATTSEPAFGFGDD